MVATELGMKAWAEPAGDRMRESIPVGRFAEPEEIAETMHRLAALQRTAD